MTIQTDREKPANHHNLSAAIAQDLDVPLSDARQILNCVLKNMVVLTGQFAYLKLKDFGRFEYRLYRARNINGLAGMNEKLPDREKLCFTSTARLNREPTK